MNINIGDVFWLDLNGTPQLIRIVSYSEDRYYYKYITAPLKSSCFHRTSLIVKSGSYLTPAREYKVLQLLKEVDEC